MTTQARVVRGLFPVAFGTPLLVLLIIYAPVLKDLVVDWWEDGNYSHGFLVPLVSAWLLWSKRGSLAKIPLATDRLGLIGVIAGLLLFIVGNGAAEYFTVRVSFVLTLSGLIWYLLGRELVKAIWFELFFLLFMIPVPYVLYYAATFPMQLLASKITVAILKMVGMGVVRQGNIIHIAGYSLEVAEACSGMRSVLTLLALGALFSQVTQKRFTSKLLLFLSTIPLAVAGNVFRVFITTILASLVGSLVVEEPVHSLLGASVFLVAFIGLFIISRILRSLFK